MTNTQQDITIKELEDNIQYYLKMRFERQYPRFKEEEVNALWDIYQEWLKNDFVFTIEGQKLAFFYKLYLQYLQNLIRRNKTAIKCYHKKKEEKQRIAAQIKEINKARKQKKDTKESNESSDSESSGLKLSDI